MGEMLVTMSSAELSEWQAFFILENRDFDEKRRAAKASSGAKSRAKGARR